MLYVVIGVFVIPVILQVLYLLVTLNQWSFFPLILGLIFQGKRLYGTWRPLIENFVIALAGGFFVFIISHKGINNIGEKIYLITYAFLLCFILAFLAKFKKSRELIIPKLTEGITLLYSIAIIYWLVDFSKDYVYAKIVYVFFFIVFCISVFSIINAFTKIPLSKTNRFLLSLWSSIAMIVFALDYIIRVFKNGEISNAVSFQQEVYLFFQYFLLGVSAIYIAQNISMIFGFLPDKNEKSYRNSRRIKVLKKDHVERYSEEQVSVWYSLFCVVFSTSLFWMNYKCQFMNRQSIIWIVFVSFPILIHFYEYVKNYKGLNSK
ncbi:hypothetical protein BIW12_07580 [Flavobacterium commune]|uniref:Uncharacterized protein n=2 Tax=Flavobacterium commune TaxID=1306519 RepID=A0A1D9P9R1_9FLAO|nr:hypothetical protein BIW12_07580 [Flavobacterium commune]